MLKNKNPAELARGLVADFDFSSAANIALQGGVITGALEYKDGGAYFDGTNDYITYGGNVQPFNSGFWSAVIEFTPNFEANAAEFYYFYGAGTAVTEAFRHNSDGTLRLYNNSLSGTIPLANYQAYWKVNQRNVLVITKTSTATFFLNGTQIYSTSVALSTPSYTSYVIGASGTNTYKFNGSISSVKFFKHYASGDLLTAGEALGYYNNDWANYEKRATCILPMTAECHDATNNRTLDVSGNARHFSFGDGSTATTFPTKLQRRGYSFDGGDYLKCLTFQLSVLPKFTMVLLGKRNGIGSGIGAGETRATPDVSFRVVNAHLGLNNNLFAAAWADGGSDSASNSDYLNAVGVEGLTYVYDGSLATTNRLAMFLNGKQLALTHGGTPPATLSDINGIVNIGRVSRTAIGVWDYTTGNIYYFAVFPFALTPLQIADLHLKLMKNINLI